MKRKSIAVVVMMILVLFGTTVGSYSSSETVTVMYNGSVIEFDQLTEIKDGRTMVPPLRSIFEALGMEVIWDDSTKQITAVKKDLVIILRIDSTNPMVNGQTVDIDSAPYIKNGRTLVPLRFITESTGAKVSWDGNTRTVFIEEGGDYVESTEIVEVIDGVETIESGDKVLTLTYPVVDTGQVTYFSDTREISSLNEGGEAFYGQDASYDGNQPSYTDHQDGTVTDNVTGLMWQQTMDEKMTYEEALTYAANSTLGGYSDWRIPNIKELFSLILFFWFFKWYNSRYPLY